MHEDSRTIKSIDWRAVFPSLNLFRAFRVALDPSKLFLGLAMILVVYGFGRLLDGVWSGVLGVPQYEYVDPQSAQLPSTTYPYGPRHSGPFDVFFKWELARFDDVTVAVKDARLTDLVLAVKGFVFDGPTWLCSRHFVFALLFSLVLLVSWAIFGGAIARIVAVQLARDAKISMRNALRFSSGKLLSFACAPLILAMFIGGLGLLIAATNLLFYVKYAGPVVVGAGFILTLAAGLLLTAAVFGSVGGFGMLYPTVAVEGTDAFDAISRSFSYLVARPGKLLAYLLVSVVYGALTFWAVKLFVVAMFLLIRWFQMLLLTKGHAADYEAFFPGPSGVQLHYDLNYEGMDNPGLRAGAGILSFWYYLVVGLVGSLHAITYYFSAWTIIYSLLRLEVDATELDDVYLEDSDDEELLEATPPPTESPATATSEFAAAAINGEPKPEDEKPEDEKGEQPATFSAAPPLP